MKPKTCVIALRREHDSKCFNSTYVSTSSTGRHLTVLSGGVFQGGSLEERQFIPPQLPPPIIEELTELEQSVLQLIEEDNKISMTQISLQLGISRDTIKEYIKRLREKQRIIRVGGNRGGYWKVL